MFRVGAGSAGNDRLTGYKDGPWSVVFYDVVARISGRYSIVSLHHHARKCGDAVWSPGSSQGCDLAGRC